MTSQQFSSSAEQSTQPSAQSAAHQIDHQSQLDSALLQLRAAYEQDKNPSLTARRAWLDALKTAIGEQQQLLADALAADYGQRPYLETQLADVLPIIQQISYCQRHLKRWLKPSKRHVGLALWPSKAEVHYQPKGVVGVMVPWNFPLMLSLGPLINALTAGNRVMLKLSEFTPNFNQVLEAILSSTLGPQVVQVFCGDVNQAKAFAQLPLDHLLFTGSTSVGRQIMAAASANLTPVTLELGGKSPVIISDDCPMLLAAERIASGKCLNAGQICVAPDYVLCPDHRLQEFVEAYRQIVSKRYPQGLASADLAAIINSNQYQRLAQLLADAKDKGATPTALLEPAIDDNKRLIAPHVLTGVNDSMAIMQQEIFGPVLPVVGYQQLSDAIDYVNQRERPLALYFMGFNKAEQQLVLGQTCSGGAAINETLYHVGVDDAPFGGTGPSGMGHYHGHEGFLTFSHARTVLTRGRFSSAKLLQPPYNRWWQKLLLRFLMR